MFFNIIYYYLVVEMVEQEKEFNMAIKNELFFLK